MNTTNATPSSPLPSTDSTTSQHLSLKNFLHSKAIELQDRQNRQSAPYIRDLLSNLHQIKFECLNADKEIRNLFSSISRKAEICDQQLQLSQKGGNSEEFVSTRRKRRRRKLRESFGFSQYKNEGFSENESDREPGFGSSDEEEPDYLRHFEMERKRNEERLWGSRQVEVDGLEARPEFREVKYTVLEADEQFGDRIKIVKE